MSQLCLIVLLLICLLVPAQRASPISAGSRSILREISSDHKEDIVVDLDASDFDSVLKDTPATHAVVEFYAHWCPGCRNYKPQYEKVARLFNGPNAAHPGVVLMTRVDCASKTNTELCDKFSVEHYPMLFWGPPSKFVSGSWKPNQEKSEIHAIEDGMTAERLLNWINKQLGSSYSLEDEKFENDHFLSNMSDPGQIARAVYDVEETTAEAFEIIFEHKMIKHETRASLIKFLELLVAHHPSKRCRKGTAEVLINFDDLYPPDGKQEVVGDVKSALANFQICGKEVPRGYWIFCRGSNNETRGFSCGLWILFHSLSVRIEDEESQFAFLTIRDFVHNFFICEECRQHFYQMCSSVKTPFNSSREFVLWLWNAHNIVNERLIKEEESLGTGDPIFPKTIWPPKQLCSPCHRPKSQKDGNGPIEWNKDDVYKFLTNYYGKSLVSLYKNKGLAGNKSAGGAGDDSVGPGNSFAVPVGAALAIALASCAFGALAWYWRWMQKSRKPRRKAESQ